MPIDYGKLSVLYQEPHRFYHNLDHIHRCIRTLEDYITQCNLEKIPIDSEVDTLVVAGIWYHDAIYIPGLDDYSVAVSSVIAEADFSPKDISRSSFHIRLRKIIEYTSHKKEIVGEEPIVLKAAKLLCDIDLSMLGGSEKQFFIDSEHVVKEYLTIPDTTRKQIEKGRQAFLLNLLKKERLYHTEHFIGKFEMQARNNMAAWCTHIDKKYSK